MSDMFKFAGVSRTDGVLKVRFVNDKNALKLINKNDKDADIVELPVPLSKINAINYLMDIKFHMVNDEIDTEVQEALSERLEYLMEKERLSRGEFKPKGRKSADGSVKQKMIVIKEPDPILAPYGWKKDGTPKAAPGRKSNTDIKPDADASITLQSIFMKKAEDATTVEDPSLEDAPF